VWVLQVLQVAWGHLGGWLACCCDWNHLHQALLLLLPLLLLQQLQSSWFLRGSML
jgi:hypothetical protein